MCHTLEGKLGVLDNGGRGGGPLTDRDSTAACSKSEGVLGVTCPTLRLSRFPRSLWPQGPTEG